MIYLKSFRLPSYNIESSQFGAQTPTYYTSLYPFQTFPAKGLEEIVFSDITIFSGSNGSGKSTLLNVISEKLGLARESEFNKTELYDKYVSLTEESMAELDPATRRSIREVSRIITSDDVFHHILEVRNKNSLLDFKRDVLKQQRREQLYYGGKRATGIDFSDPESFKEFKKANAFARRSESSAIRQFAEASERTYSNGENGFKYFTDAIKPGGLYLLDEPENSLSAQLQLDLADYLAGMARFYKCQFIISSHSPFILSMPYAKVFDMDRQPVSEVKWTEIESVQTYHNFFKEHDNEFAPIVSYSRLKT